MSAKKVGMGVVLAVWVASAQAIQTETLVVDLNVTNLAGMANNAVVAAWTNVNAALGVFVPGVTNANAGPVYNTAIGGYPAVTFAGVSTSVLTNTLPPPATICGAGNWSFETWVYNPALGSPDVPFSWTGRELWPDNLATGSCFEFRFGSDAGNALEHYGNNVGWGTLPSANAWHYVAGTRDALGVERLYLDGKLWTVYNPPVMRIRTDGALTLGGVRDMRYTNSASAWINHYSGSMARLRIHDGTLGSGAVINNYLEERGDFGLTGTFDAAWTGASDAAFPWETAANWSGSTLPNSLARVIIDNGGTAVVSTAVGAVSRFFPYRGALVINGSGAQLSVPAAAGVNVNMGTASNNVFGFLLTEGTFAMPGANNHNLYIGLNNNARGEAVIGGGAGPALLDVDKDIQIGAGGRSVGRMRIENFAEIYTSNGYFYVATGGGDGAVTMNGGLISGRRYDLDVVVGNGNGARAVFDINGGSVIPTRDFVWSTSSGSAANSIVSLNGGVIDARRLYGSTTSATNIFNLNGGTIRNRDSRADFLNNLTAAYVQSGGVTFNVATNTSVTVSQPLLGDAYSVGGGLIKVGGGSLTLSGSNTFTGNITVNGGDLWLRHTNGLAAGYSGTITLNNGASVGYEKAGGVATLMNQLSPASVGSLTLFGINASENVNFSSFPGMALGFHGTVNYTGTYTPYNNGYVFAPVAAGNVYGQTISGASSVTLNGGPAGTLELTANNSYTGGTTINGGTLVMTHVNALGDPATVTLPDIGIYNGGALKLNNAAIPTNIVQRIKPDSQGYLILTNATIGLNLDLRGLPGVIVGTDQGTLNYRGRIDPENDTYRLGGGRLAYNTGDQGLVVTNLEDGLSPRKLVVEGVGIVRPAPGNTYSGGTVVTNKGALHLREDALGAIPASPDPDNVYVDDGIIRPGDGTFSLHANRGLLVGPNGLIFETYGGRYMTVLGELSGSGIITNKGSGNVVLGGSNNTWSGLLSVDNGTFAVGSGNTFSWVKENLIGAVNGGTGYFGINYDGNLTWSDKFARPLGDIPASFMFPSGNSLSVGLRKLGSGVLTVDVAPSYVRETLIESGTLKAGVSNAIPFGAGKGNLNVANGNVFAPAGTLDVNGLTVPVNGLQGAGTVTDSASGGQLVVGNNNASATFFGNVTPSVVLAKTGTGTQTLAKGTKVHDTWVNQGILALGSEASVTGTVVVSANATLAISTATNEVYGLTGQYYNFDYPELRGLIVQTNFVSLSVINNLLAPYAPAQVVSSAPIHWNFDYSSMGTNRFQGGYNTRNNFICRWNGQFWASVDGVYGFKTASDDGSMLFIDGTTVVSNNYFQGYDLIGGKRGGTIGLTAGWHDIVVVMYQGSGDRGLTVFMTPPSGTEVVLPQNLLRPYPVKLANLTGHSAGKIEFLGNNQIAEVSPVGNAVLGCRLVSTNQQNVLVKMGSGMLTLTNQMSSEFRSLAEVRDGTLALEGSYALGACPVVVTNAGLLQVRTYNGTWPNEGLMGLYYDNTGFNGNTFTSLTVIASYFGTRTPALIAGTFQTNAAWLAREFNYDSTATPNPLFPVPYNTTRLTDFQVLYRGRLMVPEAGTYVLGLKSDDRSDLYLDGIQAITNVSSGDASGKSAAVALTAGTHDVLVPLQQGAGGYRILMTITPPGGAKVNLPNAMLRPYPSLVGPLGGNAALDLAHAGSFLRLNQSAESVFSGGITGAFGSQIEKAGAQRFTLTGGNDAFLGSWFVSQGELWAGDGATGGTLGGSNVYVSGGASLVFNRSDSIVYAGDLAGKGEIRSAGAGEVKLTGSVSNFLGSINVANGKKITLAQTLTATNSLVNNNGTFGLSGDKTFLSASRILGTGVTRLSEGGTLDLGSPAAAASFANALAVSNGVVVLAVTNATDAWHLGSLTIDAGTALEVVPSGLWGKYYDIAYDAATVSNAFRTYDSATNYFASLTPALVASTWERSATLEFGSTGAFFPGKYATNGTRTVNFAAQYVGKIRVTVPGTYTFGVASDDNGIIYIDGQPIANGNYNKGIVLKTGTVALTAGLHDFALFYAQGTGGYGLYTEITIPGQAVQRIPNNMFVAQSADTPAFSLTVDTLAVTNGPGAGTVIMPGQGVLKMSDLWIDTGARLAVTGSVACATTALSVTVPEEIPYGITVVGDFTATDGLDLSGVTLTSSRPEALLRYKNKLLYFARSNGAMLLLK